MKRLTATVVNLLYVIITVFLSNGYLLFCRNAWWLLLGIPAFLVVNIYVGAIGRKLYKRVLRKACFRFKKRRTMIRRFV